MNLVINAILAVQMLAALVMIGLILIQHGKGADMGAAFGSGGSGRLAAVGIGRPVSWTNCRRACAPSIWFFKGHFSPQSMSRKKFLRAVALLWLRSFCRFSRLVALCAWAAWMRSLWKAAWAM